MVTTIQIKDKTLDILKKVKCETKSSSYDEAIIKLVKKNDKSMAGFLGKKQLNHLMKDLRDKSDRF